MNGKKRILLITTGGTIMSVQSANGLQPGENENSLLRFPGSGQYDITVHSLLTLDSSNIQPEEWALIARCIYEMRGDYDGIVITHGTDTMAYTASALTFMLPGLDRCVVLTGSQVPVSNMLSDAYANLQCAFAMAAPLSNQGAEAAPVSTGANYRVRGISSHLPNQRSGCSLTPTVEWQRLSAEAPLTE